MQCTTRGHHTHLCCSRVHRHTGCGCVRPVHHPHTRNGGLACGTTGGISLHLHGTNLSTQGQRLHIKQRWVDKQLMQTCGSLSWPAASHRSGRGGQGLTCSCITCKHRQINHKCLQASRKGQDQLQYTASDGEADAIRT